MNVTELQERLKNPGLFINGKNWHYVSNSGMLFVSAYYDYGPSYHPNSVSSERIEKVYWIEEVLDEEAMRMNGLTLGEYSKRVVKSRYFSMIELLEIIINERA
jgi:hypothetical protein